MKINIIDSYNSFLQQKNPSNYVVFMFSASWCPPCQATKKFLQSIPSPMENIKEDIYNIINSELENNNNILEYYQYYIKEYVMNFLTVWFQSNIQDKINDHNKIKQIFIERLEEFIVNLLKKKQIYNNDDVKNYLKTFMEKIDENMDESCDFNQSTSIDLQETIVKIVAKIFLEISQEKNINYSHDIEQKKKHIKDNLCFSIVIVDVDQHGDLASKYGIRSIPTFVVCHIGQEHTEIANLPGSFNNVAQMKTKFHSVWKAIIEHMKTQNTL